MFCMCIDRGCVGTWESKLCSVCLLTAGALVQARIKYVLYYMAAGVLVQGRVSYVLYVY